MASKTSQRSEIASVVNSALKNLNELGQSLKAYQFGNDTAELLCVDGIVETIKELEAERIRLHELLETETIKASGLRYKLHYFPGDISSEIQAAVTSARQSNEVEIKRLKFQLEGIDKNVSDLEKQYRNLQEENSTLEPDRDDMQMGHDEIIALLNQKMADKASKQITLNETRDKLRETYKRIIDLEESMVQLKEDLRRERVEARMEKDDLHQSVENTKLKVTEQRKLNDLKREEIDKLQVELVDSESVLESKKKVIRKCETSRARFESQEMQLNKDLQKEIRSNAALTQEGMKIVKSNEAISNKLNNEKLKIEELLKQYEKSIGAAEKENAKLSREKLILEKELKVAEVAEKSDKELVGDAERKLARAKMELAEQNQECGRLQGENLEMEQDIEALALSHQAEVDVLNKKIEESKTELVTEKQERLLLQNSKDTVTKEANQFKAEYGKEMATMSRMISSGKAEHSKCTEYGNELKKTLKLDEQEIITKQNQIKNLKQEYTRLQKQLKSELQAVQENITKLGKEQESKKDNIEDKTPIFKDLEQQFKKRSEDFEAVKKNVAVMKNKKANLEIAVERAERDVEKMAAPQTRLKEELKCKRAEALKQLAHQAEEIQGVEKEIISTGQKLGTILNENSKFKQAKNLLEMEIAGLQKLLLGNSLTRESLAEELFNYRGILRESWREDVILDKTYAENDVQVLANIDQLQQKTDEREKRIDTIHEQLEEQLVVLSHFIDGVANLRPKDSAPPR